MSTPLLIDLYRRDPSGNSTIVVQNLKDNVRKDSLQNYLEVICSQELTDIYFPVRGVAVAIFEKKIEEIDKWQEKALKRTFEGSNLSLQLLGQPAGVFMTELPERISEEFLSLYFESKRAGGEEDTVENVEIVDVCSVKQAIIEISSENAIKSVLTKPTHQLKNTAIKLEPYYQPVHRYTPQVLKPRHQCKETGISLAQGSNVIYERTTFPVSVSPRHPQVKPRSTIPPFQPQLEYRSASPRQPQIKPRSESPPRQHQLQFRSASPPMQENGTSRLITSKDNSGEEFEPMSHIPASLNTKQRNYDSYQKQRPLTQPKGAELSSNDFKLKIISDDPEDQVRQIPRKSPGCVVAPDLHEDDLRLSVPCQSQDEHRHYDFSNFQNSNVAAVKPVVRNVQRQISNGSADGKSRAKDRRHKQRSNDTDTQMSLNCEKEMQLTPVKITMLIIYRFQTKTQTDTLKIIFKEKEGKVIIKGNSDEDILQAKLKIHECLEQIACCAESFPRMKCIFLSRDASRKCLKARCIKQKVRATYEVDESEKIIRTYAFARDAAERCLQLIKEEITVIKVQLRPGQEQVLHDEDWRRTAESFDTGLTTIYQDESASNLVIESFVKIKAEEAKSKIIEYLKLHIPKKSGEVILESAKARCFKSYFEEKLRRCVEKVHGKCDVKVLSSTPFKIRVCVEGEESLIAELTKMVNQIWHEKIDFSKIADRVEDRWLMMKGLDSSTGKDFFRNFEKNQNCYLQISKDGEIKLTKPSIQLDDVENIVHQREEDKLTKSGPTFEIESGDFKTSHEQELEEFESPLYNAHRRERENRYLYQAGLDEEDALAQAIMISAKEQESLTTNDFGYDDNEDELSALRLMNRQQSEGEIFEKRQMRAPARDIRRSASSPVFRSQMSVPAVVSSKGESIQMMQATVRLIQGEIVKQKADVLVNIVSPSHSLTESVVSKAFVRRAGQEIIQLYNAARHQSSGVVVKTTSCGHLSCASVLHVVLQKGEQYCRKMIHEAVSEILQECENSGSTSVAFPPLGVGRMYKYSAETVAERMLAEIYLHLQNGIGRINQVTLVIYDDPTFTVFEKAFRSFDPHSVQRYTVVQARPFYKQDPYQQADDNTPLQQRLLAQNQRRIFSQQAVPPRDPRNRPTMLTAVNSGGRRQTPEFHIGHLHQKRTNNKFQDVSERARIARHQRASSPRRVRLSREGLKERNYGGKNMSKVKRPPRSRFQEKKPAPNLAVVVIAESRDRCVKARNQLGKLIKEEFLHEEDIEKRQKISVDAKKKIVSVIERHNIESIKGKQKYTLRGHKESVARARTGILEVLLEEKDNTDKRRKRKENAKRETEEFVKYMVEEDPEVPSYWTNYKPDVTLKAILTKVRDAFSSSNFKKEPVDSNTNTFNTIVNMVNRTFDSSKVGQGQDAVGLNQFRYTQLRVLKIQRIENLELYEKFTSTRQKLYLQLLRSRDVRFPRVQQLPNCTGPIQTCQHVNSYLDKDLHSEINEVFLFHGTKYENVGTICTSGLDPRLGSGKAMFGPGIYGAETSTKADQYSDDKTTRTGGQGNRKKMFLIRMILGNSYLCNDTNPHKYRRPPCTTCFKDDCKDTRHGRAKFGHLFNSVIGDNGKLFREFVVYESSLCYPEYLITYERL